MKRILCIATLVCSLGILFAQESVPGTSHISPDTFQYETMNKNALIFTAGTIIFSGAFTFSYERIIIENKKPAFRALTAKAGIGRLAGWVFGEFKYTICSLTMGILLGRESSFFEIGMGAVLLEGYQQFSFIITTDKTYDTYIYPSGSLGYRYQKPGGNFIFRGGAAYPESFYLSIGVCF